MSRFNRSVIPPVTPVTAPITTTGASAVNHQGGTGYARTPQSELFLLCVNYLEGGRFYGDEDKRFKELVRLGAIADAAWTFDMLRWLRRDANLRTAPLIGAAEFVRARLDAKMPPLYLDNEAGRIVDEAGLDNYSEAWTGVNRALIRDVLQRPDEPGEMIAYWTENYGRNIPKPVKRGVADAFGRMASERSYLKYDSDKAAYRFADIIELVHPKGRALGKDALFRHALDARHDRPDVSFTGLPMLSQRRELFAIPRDRRADVLRSPEAVDLMSRAGMTWESTSSWLGRSLDARAWEVLLPSLGLMAAIRNARNMDNANVDTKALMPTFMRLMDAQEVRRSKMLPFRFLSAYRHSHLRWHGALDAALTLSLANVPALGGRTLILVDRSESMFGTVSERSELNYADTAALFGSALALRAKDADLVEFGTSSDRVTFKGNDSPLKLVEKFRHLGGTYTAEAVRRWYNKHDRVIIITDEQAGWYSGSPGDCIPQSVPMYTWNLAGYRYGHDKSGANNRFTSGGLSDQSFGLIPMLEGVTKGQWPWMKS